MSRARDIANFGNGIDAADITDATITAGKLAAGAVEGALVTATGRRNLIINGAMVIDQRNNGSTVTAHNSYAVDRFRISESTTTGTFEASRSTEAPDDFTNSLLFKVKTTDTSIGAEYAGIRYKVEGHDMAHLNFGTSAAKTITLSFYVKFSVTGTYGGAIGNGSDRTYPFSYTVNTADTWERKTITIEGSTSGTFASDNAMGFELWLLSIGGTSYGNEAAGAWVDSYEISPTGVTNFYATDESTYYITGVQLEVGAVATPFEHRSYGEELALCQRYYQIFNKDNVNNYGAVGQCSSSTTAQFIYPLQQIMRTEPTVSTNNATYFRITNAAISGVPTVTSISFYPANTLKVCRFITTVSSGLVAGDASLLISNGAGYGQIYFDAEL
jgi:hypothetical protein